MKTSHTMRTRAQQLRDQAHALPAPLAAAYRRRAAELEFQAFLLDPHAELLAA